MKENLKISVAMIVKNEEEMLGRCLKTVKGADEIVVCDTGSTDKTVEIAKKFTDKVFTDFTWCDHFGKARQHSKDKCTGDWILTIDADEVLLNTFEEVREVINKADAEGCQFVNVTTLAENNHSRNRFPRIYKNIPEIQWRGAAHNYLVITEGKRKTYESNIIERYGYSPAHKLDPNRTMRILENAVKEDGSLTRERYYLGREYMYRKKYDECISVLEEYLKRSDFKPERSDAYLMIAKAYWFTQRGDKAREACLQSIGINPNFKEALLLMADMYYEPNRSRWASFAELADNTGVLFVRQKGDVVKQEVGSEGSELTSTSK
jgi:glycosyltransferase involved in cell wall biosynthesis